MKELYDSRKTRLRCILIFLFTISLMIPLALQAQSARISETKQSIKTYPFSDPSPVPILIKDPAIYPYFRFGGYTEKAQKQQWKVVTMENDYIKLSVLPQVGGKVWGAVEKSTGKDFIYHNDVLKFRDVSLRGPWTSGGIEFNFGYLGHTPSTATPVDYLLKNNEDGSVSCFIGGLDLASRTQWRVEIRLPKDAASFQTNGFWYNATPLNQSYYYWSNAAIHAGDDLEFYFPGTNYIGHGGDVHSWPVDAEGRQLSTYRENDFGSNKSYHVLGKYKNYTGAYWNDHNFGYGRWARYNEMPGKKIWIWALSRNGGIWEDLLTDNNGQYVEVQSGRLFSQANFNSGYTTPFNQYLFTPGAADLWEEYWFPIKGIGGIADTSPYGSVNVTNKDNQLKVALNAIQPIQDTLQVKTGNKIIYSKAVKLRPMDVFKAEVDISPSGRQSYTISLGDELTASTNQSDSTKLRRPMQSEQQYDVKSAEGQFEIGEEQLASRQYDQALQSYLKSLKMLPNQRKAISRVAEIYTRKGLYEKALDYAKQVLKNDAYDAYGNLIYGVLNRKMGRLVQAKEAFGWAARSMKYRSLGLEKIAEINIQQHNWKDAIYYAQKALRFNDANMGAYKMLAIAYRKKQNTERANQVLAKMLDIDPLNHTANVEQYFLTSTAKHKEKFTHLIRNELAYETYLELAVDYNKLGLRNEAQTILELAPSQPIIHYWLAYLYRNTAKASAYLDKAVKAAPELVFPSRLETIPVLNWASRQNDHWKTKYYLGLLLWSKGRTDKALRLMNDCGNEPVFAPFYISRSYLRNDTPTLAKQDARRALEVGQKEWRTYHRLSDWLISRKKYNEAAVIARKAYDRFPKNYYIGGQYAGILYELGNYKQSLDILSNLQVLPSEGAKRNHNIFVKDHLMLALKNIRSHKYTRALDHLNSSRTWPEHLGTGKPYNPDERLQDYLEARVDFKQGRNQQAEKLFDKVLDYSRGNWDSIKGQGFSAGNYVSYLLFKREGSEKKADDLLALFEQQLGREKFRLYGVKKGLGFKSRADSEPPAWLNGLREMDSVLQ